MNGTQFSSRLSFAFTLLEVLTALGVFSFAVLGLLFAMNVVADASHDIQRQRAIRSELESRLARLSLLPLREFSAVDDHEGVRYEEVTRPEPQQEGDGTVRDGYWRVSVHAEWRDKGDLRNWDASHLIWNP